MTEKRSLGLGPKNTAQKTRRLKEGSGAFCGQTFVRTFAERCRGSAAEGVRPGGGRSPWGSMNARYIELALYIADLTSQGWVGGQHGVNALTGVHDRRVVFISKAGPEVGERRA